MSTNSTRPDRYRLTNTLFSVCLLMTLSLFWGLPLHARSSSYKLNTPERFSDYVVEFAEKNYADLEVEKTDSPFVLKMKDGGRISLENLYKNVRNLRSKKLIRRQVSRFLSVIGKKPQKIDSWDQVKSRIRPQIFPRDYLKNKQMNKRLISKPLDFSSELMEGYVIDSEKAFQYIQKEHLKKWGTDLETVKTTAYENLDLACRNTKMRLKSLRGENATGKYIIISVNDGYAAARLLLPQIRNEIETKLGKPCYVAIPNRDFLIAWSYDLSSKKKFKRQIIRDFHYRDHPLSPKVFAIINSQVKNSSILEKEKDDDSTTNDGSKEDSSEAKNSGSENSSKSKNSNRSKYSSGKPF